MVEALLHNSLGQVVDTFCLCHHRIATGEKTEKVFYLILCIILSAFCIVITCVSHA